MLDRQREYHFGYSQNNETNLGRKTYITRKTVNKFTPSKGA